MNLSIIPAMALFQEIQALTAKTTIIILIRILLDNTPNIMAIMTTDMPEDTVAVTAPDIMTAIKRQTRADISTVMKAPLMICFRTTKRLIKR